MLRHGRLVWIRTRTLRAVANRGRAKAPASRASRAGGNNRCRVRLFVPASNSTFHRHGRRSPRCTAAFAARRATFRKMKSRVAIRRAAASLPKRRLAIEPLEPRALLTADGWTGYARDPQHTALSAYASQSLSSIAWRWKAITGRDLWRAYRQSFRNERKLLGPLTATTHDAPRAARS